MIISRSGDQDHWQAKDWGGGGGGGGGKGTDFARGVMLMPSFHK